MFECRECRNCLGCTKERTNIVHFHFTIFLSIFLSLFSKQIERATNAVYILVQCCTAISWLLICPPIWGAKTRLGRKNLESIFFPRPAKRGLHCLYWPSLNILGWSVAKSYKHRKLCECFSSAKRLRKTITSPFQWTFFFSFLPSISETTGSQAKLFLQ